MSLQVSRWKLGAIHALPPEADWMTRRPWKEGERLLFAVATEGPAVVTDKGYLKWQVGRELALVPGRGQHQVARATPRVLRLEHLQDISEADAELELVRMWPDPIGQLAENPIAIFSALWDSIYATHPRLQWDANPKVWALGFKRSETVFVEAPCTPKP